MSRYLAHTGTHGKRALFALITACAVAIAALGVGGNALADGHYDPTPEGMAAAANAFVDAVDLADNDSVAVDPDGTISIQGTRYVYEPADALGLANRWIGWQEDRIATGARADSNFATAKAAQEAYRTTLAVCQRFYGQACAYASVNPGLDPVDPGNVDVRIEAVLSQRGESITLRLWQQSRNGAWAESAAGPAVTLDAGDFNNNPTRFQCLSATLTPLSNNNSVMIAVNKTLSDDPDRNGHYDVKVAGLDRAGRCVGLATPAQNRVLTNTRDGRLLRSSEVSIPGVPNTWWMSAP